MKCFLCKGDTVKSTTTYMTAYKNCYIIIKRGEMIHEEIS